MGDRLRNKVALVTGGAGGIGAAVGRLFCEEGATVALVDHDAEAMARIAAEIRDAVPGAAVLDIVGDVGAEATAGAAVAATLARFGGVDTLVNVAGIRAYEPLAEAESATWHRILAVNLLSYAWFARAALPELRRRRGSIVNVSSTHGQKPRAGMGQYDATKAGILSMTQTLAFEEAAHGVRVNAICPGLTLTPFHKRRAAAAGRSEEELARDAESYCLLRRWADPREVAWPMLWLASDEASYMTGAVLTVDGGAFVHQH